MKNGVYCLASDGIYEHFNAFIKSFRKYNSLPLTVIKYDNNTSKIEKLASRYNFKVWQPIEAERMVQIGSKFYKNREDWPKIFKKICSFWGEYDSFLFFDADIIILGNIEEVLLKFASTEKEILYFDFDRAWVYNNNIFIKKMETEHDSKHINTGTWGGKKNGITLESIEDTMKDFNNFNKHFVDVIEQPFLNYCIDINNLKKIRIDELDYKYSFSCWYNLDYIEKNNIIYWTSDEKKTGKLLAIHWAGCHFSDIYKHHSSDQFLKYRLLNENPIVKYKYFLEFFHINSYQVLTKIYLYKMIKLFIS